MSTVTIGSPASLSRERVSEALAAATGRIAPVWPLERFVAVNPYFGLADRPFADAATLLARVGGARSTMPIEWYLTAAQDDTITAAALEAVLKTSSGDHPRAPVEFLRYCRTMGTGRGVGARIPSVARTASAATGRDWHHLMTERISAWAASFFDTGQATWRASVPGGGAYGAWRHEASIDRTPEVMGLPGFRRAVQALPADPLDLSALALETLGLDSESTTPYLHALLVQVGGWSAHCAWLGFEAGLHDEADDTIIEFAAILLAWELVLHQTLTARGIDTGWAAAQADADWTLSRPDPLLDAQLILQEALDRSERDRLASRLDPQGRSVPATAARAGAQAIFCIDVRSEVLRRHLEALGDVETLGFAGFFGVAVEFVPIAHDSGSPQCPVLLRPAHTVFETTGPDGDLQEAARRRRLAHHVQRAWKSFKMGAISCFSFVGPVGLLYLPKLFADSAGRARPNAGPATEGLTAAQSEGRGPDLSGVVGAGVANGIDLDARVDLAEAILRSTSLHDDLADIVLIVGHGASTVNNPYESSLHCGACGGNSGEANARIAAAILNDADVRAALRVRGLVIPGGTWFIGALHDTTTDEVTLFDRGAIPVDHAGRLAVIEADLAAASRAARVERAERLGLEVGPELDEAIFHRSRDWAQVRPEWGLAGCRSFIAAPRSRTAGIDLHGNAFLHSYDWRRDANFAVLELILTAPVVVASWISLQYFASTVEPRIYGSGNKTLHNVTGRLGVVEGNGGDLRTGLPWQSIHDGAQLQHEPLRLDVIIEAPLDAIDDVLARNQHIGDLCRNGWIHLSALDDDGTVAHRYLASGSWERA
ncbi:MAG: DUF2309 domain-containing protein [Aquihabitans sp.]